MGQAKRRGTYEERKANAIARDKAFLQAVNEGKFGEEIKALHQYHKFKPHKLLNALMLAGVVSVSTTNKE